MKIELYTRPNCTLCVETKAFLIDHGLTYTEKLVDVDITRDDLLARFPTARKLPVVVIDDEYIGGKHETITLLENEIQWNPL